MSGVIDDNGVQWEHCNACRAWVKYQALKYEAPSTSYPYGRDLCAKCMESFMQQTNNRSQVL